MTRADLTYSNNELFFNNINLVKQKPHKTPYYLYSMKIFSENIQSFLNEAQARFDKVKVCYALKANSHPTFIKELARLNIGADVVSIGELEFAIANGIKPKNIVFSGVGKTKEEIIKAMDYQIYSFNVESFSELEFINLESKRRNIKTDIAIRLNPKVNSLTHQYISTGNKIHKFGILISEFSKNYKKNDPKYWSNINLKGLSIHIGSQLTNLEATSQGIRALCQCIEDLSLSLDFIDVGGGLGVDYYTSKEKLTIPSTQHYMDLIKKSLGHFARKHTIVFEPGRKIVANAGVLVTKVIREKESEGHNFLIIDAGMNDLMRPCLYQAKHQLLSFKQTDNHKKYDIVGPICESSDSFLTNYEMSEVKEDDLLVIADTGAYGKSLSNTYNMRTLIQEFFLEE